MPNSKPITSGYRGRWAWVNLTKRTVRLAEADPDLCRDYVGGRGLQARLLSDRLASGAPLEDPLGPANRIVIGSAAVNDTAIPTAGRGSCSFFGTMARSPEPVGWAPGGKPLYGMVTHSSAGGLFHNMLKRAGIDQLIIDGRAERPVRIEAVEGSVRIIDAEPSLFQTVGGRTVPRTASAITDELSRKLKGSSTLCVGPAGWNLVDFACLTADYHRNFGRGGAGAVFGSKNLVAVTAYGKAPVAYADPEGFKKLGAELDRLIKASVDDPARTASFRPTTGTTWWLDRAFNGRYLGLKGGYLPWHNFDEGSFDPADYAQVSTDAFLEIAGKHNVCNKCRHIFCTRSARVESGPYAGAGVRPEFETIALWINCCILNRDAIFHMNYLCNELGVDTMTFGSVMAGAMEMSEKGLLDKYGSRLRFGDAPEMIQALKDIAYAATDLGRLLGRHTDRVIAEAADRAGAGAAGDLAYCATTARGGLGYAGINPKSFPGMFTAYGTSNRGRGDHTYAWTIQAEEGGLKDARDLAAYVAEGQAGKALVDSLGLCDFFTGDITAEPFLSLYRALTGVDYTAESLKACGRRIYALERRLNNIQGRDRSYDAYVPPKLKVPMTRGAHRGRAVDEAFYHAVLDAYYDAWGWSRDGLVPAKEG
ncbi:MAG TPA: aldehyde ferredoxin oxidoreductase C-terminal domain-containing protein [Terriglobales bacterium]|nr:aldehyde ferredoxin oxidoreductase C-terminal domain-containing protein [Terriglobales bacterium]